MKTKAIERLRGAIHRLETIQNHATIDMDVHVTDVSAISGELRQRYESTPNYYHGRPIAAEEVLAEMGLADVDMALIWQNPAATAYCGNPDHDYEALSAANRYVDEVAYEHPERFIPAGWTDPKALGLGGALRLIDVMVEEWGFPIVKLNPAQNRFPIDSEPVCAVVDRIVSLGAVPAFHFGADTAFTPADGLERLARRHPESPILAVHMGGGGAAYPEADALYLAARELGLRCPNVRFIFSAKRDTHIESDLITYQLAGAPCCEHLFFGSDAPYGRMTWNFGGARAMLRSLEDSTRHPDPRVRAHPGLFHAGTAQNYLGRNAAVFLRECCLRLLTHQVGADAPAPPAVTLPPTVSLP